MYTYILFHSYNYCCCYSYCRWHGGGVIVSVVATAVVILAMLLLWLLVADGVVVGTTVR